MKTDVLSNVHPFRVHHSKERYLLLPDFDHRIIEDGHTLLPLFNGLLFGEIFHDAKVFLYNKKRQKCRLMQYFNNKLYLCDYTIQ